MKEHYLQLFKYDDWASAKLIAVLVENQIHNETILQRLAHIVFARQIWLRRILGGKTPNDFKNPTLNLCVATFENDKKQWMNYLERTKDEDFSKTLVYRNLKGDEFQDEIKNILTHVINHSTYHRGQITAILKPLYDAVPSTDFIFFLREI